MGHYHRIINLTQRKVIEPTDVGVLDKLVEFGLSSGTAMAAVWMLLGSEAWCGDRVAILGYEGRPNDLAPAVVADTGLDGTAFYCDSLEPAGQLARDVLTDRGICVFARRISNGVELWDASPASDTAPSGVDVVVADLDRREVLDPLQFGDSRDLTLAARTGGIGGITTALTAVLAASNRGGSRGGGDFHSRDPIVGSWAGDRIGVVPIRSTSGFADVSGQLRNVLATTGEAAYELNGSVVTRLRPPSWANAIHL